MHKNSVYFKPSAFNPQILRIIKRMTFRDALKNRFLHKYLSMSIVVSDAVVLLKNMSDTLPPDANPIISVLFFHDTHQLHSIDSKSIFLKNRFNSNLARNEKQLLSIS